MSFAALPLVVVIAGAVVTAGIVVTLYLLKSTPRPQPVSNVDFWIKAVERAKPSWVFSTRVPWIAMLLTLLAALLIVLLSGDPFLGDDRAVTTVAVLDAGRSMASVDGRGRSRAARAEELLRQLATQSTRAGRLAVVRAGVRPSLLLPLTGDPADLDRALDGHRPDDGPSDLDGAIALADQILSHRTARDLARVVVISDHQPTSTSLSASMWVVPVGEAGQTLSIVAFGARRDPTALGEFGVYCAVRAFTKAPAKARLVIRDHELVLHEEELELEAGETAVRRARGFSSDISEVTAALEDIEIEGGRDALSRDDRAFAVVEPLARTKVQVVTNGNRFLEAALRVDPMVELETTTPVEYDAAAAARDFDVVVMDRVLPAGPLRHPGLLLVAPPERRDGLRLGPTLRDVEVSAARSIHPVLESVELDGVRFQSARALLPEPADRPLLRSKRSVLATARDTGGRRQVVLGFDPSSSNIVERPAFPLLMHNAVVWLANQQTLARSSRHPGQPIPFGGARARVELPGGERREARDGAFFGTGAAGLYRVAGRPYAVSAVDFAGPLTAPETTARRDDTEREPPIGLWIALALLLVLAAEWFLLHRGRV